MPLDTLLFEVMGILSYLRGDDLTEGRTLAPETQPSWQTTPFPYDVVTDQRTALLNANTQNALRIADAYACVRVLADSVASLPPKVYRRTPTGRVPAGDDSRAVALLRQPSPGSTSADLFSQVMVHLNVLGEAFIGKYRSDSEIVQLALIHPDRVKVELRGQRIVYTLDSRTEHGPEDILHIKGMSSDGLRGLSPVSQCRLALSLSSNLQEHAKQYFEQGSRPSGVLRIDPGSSQEAVERWYESWRAGHEGVERMHRVMVVSGEADFTPISFTPDDSQFLQQRELSAREVARIFRVPAWAIDAPTGDSLTYSNVLEQNRHFVTHSLRPWLVRIERAFTNDADLCPGVTYLSFDLDGLLRADAAQRADIYTKALNAETGWLSRSEVRELEDLPGEGDANA